METLCELQTKIMVYDTNPEVAGIISNLSGTQNLGCYHSVQFDILDFLANPHASNTDLGALFLTDEEDDNGLSGFHIAEKLTKYRVALPLFIRISNPSSLRYIEQNPQLRFAGTYTLEDTSALKILLSHYLFTAHYPLAIVNRFQQIGLDVLSSMIKDLKIQPMTPFLVKDFLLTKKISSLMPLTLSCGKGHVLVQINYDELAQIFEDRHCSFDTTTFGETDFDQFLSECVNLISGQLRIFFSGDIGSFHAMDYSQIPIVINDKRNDISFGCTRPQLCLRYGLGKKGQNDATQTSLDIKLIFNVRWSDIDLSTLLQQDQAIPDGVEIL